MTGQRAIATRPTPVRVHIENEPGSTTDAVTPERFEAAARRFRDLRRRIVVTYGEDPANFDAAVRAAEILVISHVSGSDLKRRAPSLRWIQSTSAGVENLVRKLPPDVILTNASGVHGPKGGEYGLTALLMLNHRVPHFVTQQRARRWSPAFSDRITGKTVVIVGVGAIGEAVARLVRRFGLRVLGVRRSGKPHPLVERMYRPKDLAKAFARADFVVLTLPLTPESRGLVGRRELDALPRHAGIVNLGRGGVMDYDALADKLEREELGGAVLDVFPEEPIPADSRLWTTPNLVASPHCAVDDAREYVTRCLDIFFDNLGRYLAGRPLRNRIDPALGY